MFLPLEVLDNIEKVKFEKNTVYRNEFDTLQPFLLHRELLSLIAIPSGLNEQGFRRYAEYLNYTTPDGEQHSTKVTCFSKGIIGDILYLGHDTKHGVCYLLRKTITDYTVETYLVMKLSLLTLLEHLDKSGDDSILTPKEKEELLTKLVKEPWYEEWLLMSKFDEQHSLLEACSIDAAPLDLMGIKRKLPDYRSKLFSSNFSKVKGSDYFTKYLGWENNSVISLNDAIQDITPLDFRGVRHICLSHRHLEHILKNGSKVILILMDKDTNVAELSRFCLLLTFKGSYYIELYALDGASGKYEFDGMTQFIWDRTSLAALDKESLLRYLRDDYVYMSEGFKLLVSITDNKLDWISVKMTIFDYKSVQVELEYEYHSYFVDIELKNDNITYSRKLISLNANMLADRIEQEAIRVISGG